MPWDGSELWAAGFDEAGARAAPRLVAGGRMSRSSSRNGPRRGCCISSPTAAAGGTCTAGRKARSKRCARWRPSSACRSGSFDVSTYGFAGRALVCIYAQAGRRQLAWLDPTTRAGPVDLPYTELDRLKAEDGMVVFDRRLANRARAVFAVDPASRRVISARAVKACDGARYLSIPQAIEFPPPRPDGARLLLPTGEPATSRAPSELPAAAGAQPRRADRAARTVRSRAPVSGPAAALPWWTSTTAAAPAMAGPTASA